MLGKDLFGTVDWTGVQSFAYICRVLHLESGLDVLDRRGHKRNSQSGQASSHDVAHERQSGRSRSWDGCVRAFGYGVDVVCVFIAVENVFVDETAVKGEGPEHAGEDPI